MDHKGLKESFWMHTCGDEKGKMKGDIEELYLKKPGKTNKDVQ